MKKSFLTKIAYDNGLWIISLLLLILSSFGNLIYLQSNPQEIKSLAFINMKGLDIFGYQLDFLLQNHLLGYFFRFVLLFGTALVLQYISSEFRLIRVRNFFPFFLFCILSATINPILSLDGSAVCCFFFCWSCLRLFGALEKGSVNRGVFDASALLAIASLFQSRILYILPVFWVVMGILQIFSFKSFLASFIGALSIIWVVGGLSFLWNDYDFLIAAGQDFISFRFVDFSEFSSAVIAYTSFLGILMVSAMFSFWPRQNLDKLRTRNYLNSVLLLWFALLTLWFFSGNNMGFLLCLFSLSSLMAAHFFSLIDTLYSRTLFISFVFLSVIVYFLL